MKHLSNKIIAVVTAIILLNLFNSSLTHHATAQSSDFDSLVQECIDTFGEECGEIIKDAKKNGSTNTEDEKEFDVK